LRPSENLSWSNTQVAPDATISKSLNRWMAHTPSRSLWPLSGLII
jgi:hypothetical protein